MNHPVLYIAGSNVSQLTVVTTQPQDFRSTTMKRDRTICYVIITKMILVIFFSFRKKMAIENCNVRRNPIEIGKFFLHKNPSYMALQKIMNEWE